MVRTRRFAALFVLGTVTVATVALIATPAYGIVTGPCGGSVSFSNGAVIFAAQPLDPATAIPDMDNALYEGSIDIPPPDEPIPFSGGLSAEVAGFRTFTFIQWGGTTEEVSETGSYPYEVPAWVPRGTGEILLTANHQQGGAECAGSVKVTLEGDPGAAAIIAAVGTLVFGAGVISAGVKKKGTV